MMESNTFSLSQLSKLFIKYATLSIIYILIFVFFLEVSQSFHQLLLRNFVMNPLPTLHHRFQMLLRLLVLQLHLRPLLEEL